MTITSFVANGETYTFPQPIDSDSHNFYNLTTRSVRLPDVSGGYDTRGASANEKENGNVAITYTIKHGWAKQTYSETDTDIAMRKAMDAVHRLAYVGRGKLYKTFGDDSRWMWGKISNISMPTNQARPTNLWQPVRMNFSSALPFWFKAGTETATNWGEFSWGDGTPWGGSAVAVAASGLTTTWTETYSNGIAPTLVRVSIVAGTNGAENPTLQRIVDGAVVDEVSWTGVMVDTDELQIHSRAKQVQLNSVDEYANFTYETSAWMMLEPGANSMKLTMANASDEADVYLRYYEVF